MRSLCERDLLDIYVGADQHVIKEEDLPLFGLEHLPPLAVHRLNERLAQHQRALLRVQLLKGARDSGGRSWGSKGETAPQERMSHQGLAEHSHRRRSFNIQTHSLTRTHIHTHKRTYLSLCRTYSLSNSYRISLSARQRDRG